MTWTLPIFSYFHTYYALKWTKFVRFCTKKVMRLKKAVFIYKFKQFFLRVIFSLSKWRIWFSQDLHQSFREWNKLVKKDICLNKAVLFYNLHCFLSSRHHFLCNMTHITFCSYNLKKKRCKKTKYDLNTANFFIFSYLLCSEMDKICKILPKKGYAF